MQVTRKTNESKIEVRLDPMGLGPDYKKGLYTPCAMLSHMLEHIAYRSGIGIAVDCCYDDGFSLPHVLFEDLGITLGRAFAELLEVQRAQGAYGFGDAVGLIDEAYARAAFSFESRALFVFDSKVAIPVLCEDCKSEDLHTFLDGFCQGARCTLHLDVCKGENSHHIWEAWYRAVGSALEQVFTKNPARAGKTSGVAGAITFEIEV